MPENYHMIGYVREGPQALSQTLRFNESAVHAIVDDVRKSDIRRVVLTGLGSSFTAVTMAGPLFIEYCPLPITFLPATEIGYFKERLVDRHTLLVVVSRSGERGAVVDVLADGQRAGTLCIAITGVADSLLARRAQRALITQEGPEITFPKTKSVLVCAGLLMRLGLALADEADQEAKQSYQTLLKLPEAISDTILGLEEPFRALMPVLASHSMAAIVGSGSNIGVALEAAIKFQEAAYIPTRGESTIGLIHGPVGALDSRWLVVPLVTQSDQSMCIDLLKLSHQFGAHSLCIHEPGINLAQWSDFQLQVSASVNPFLCALLFLPTIQLLAYYWTLARGLNPDAPASMRAILDSILPPGREEPELR